MRKSGFATKSEDLEPYFFLPSGGEEMASEVDFLRMRATCTHYDTYPTCVVDAEGELVCIAPKAIAEHIAKLMNEGADRARI
jgi:hypothetical protein